MSAHLLDTTAANEKHMSMPGREATAELGQVDAQLPADRKARNLQTNRRGMLKAVLGVAAATVGAGALLETNASTARADGTEGPTTFTSTDSTAVTAHSSSGYAVIGISDSFIGLYGATGSTSASATAIFGALTSSTPGKSSAAVSGQCAGSGSTGSGVWGSHSASGTGVYGTSPRGVGVNGYSGSGTGVYGYSPNGTGVYGYSPSGWSGYFNGSVQVTGTLSKGGGSFKIDHPLDPAHKYLSHSFVESPDMLNIYNGVVTLDAHGEAVVELPTWFDAVNRDVRYQLTAIGTAGPNLHIGEKMRGTRFKIAGGQPGMEVSWQVTGIRQDAWAQAHRIVVEEDKPAAERGSFLHPELYGEPAEKGLGWKPQPE